MENSSDLAVLHKLEHLKEIRSKTLSLERIKGKLRQEIDATENEEKLIGDYKKEMELLLQEKMAHVEELRLIHADINLMETTIKQAEESRSRGLQTSKQLFDDYRPLRDKVNIMRRRIGLPPVTDLIEEDNKLTAQYFEGAKSEYLCDQQQQQQQHQQQHQSTSISIETPQPAMIQISAVSAPKPTVAMSCPKLLPTDQPRQPFRQQPPPMKACLSCHQQIHRNAPICPLCKAKSRSRNPKKPKRKLDE